MTLEELIKCEVIALDPNKKYVIKLKDDLTYNQITRIRKLLQQEEFRKFGGFLLFGDQVESIEESTE